jgi:replicative DNA helicase
MNNKGITRRAALALVPGLALVPLVERQQSEYDQDLQAAVLGAVMQRPAAVRPLRAVLKPWHFQQGDFREVFRAMLALDDRDIQVNPDRVAGELSRRGTLVEVGGVARLTELMRSAPSKWNLASYASDLVARSENFV